MYASSPRTSWKAATCTTATPSTHSQKPTRARGVSVVAPRGLLMRRTRIAGVLSLERGGHVLDGAHEVARQLLRLLARHDRFLVVQVEAQLPVVVDHRQH